MPAGRRSRWSSPKIFAAQRATPDNMLSIPEMSKAEND